MPATSMAIRKGKNAKRPSSLRALRNWQAAQEAMVEDMALAAQLQRRLVPVAPASDGLDVSVTYEPWGPVGGDYVDVLPVGDGRALLTVADVSGKGFPAALIAASVHTLVHSETRPGIGMGALAAALNGYLCSFLADGCYVTMLLIAIDPATGVLECVNAGHPPALVVAPSGQVDWLQSGANLPLGIISTTFETQRTVLPDGCLLAMLTDGWTASTDATGHHLSVESLGRYIACAYTSRTAVPTNKVAAGFIRLLKRRLRGFPQSDDRTFLMARRTWARCPSVSSTPQGLCAA